MSHTVSQDYKIVLNEKDPVKSILQNVAVILSTRLGEVPLYRDFGIDFSFLDRPASVIKPLLFTAVSEAIERFEPRVMVVDITFEQDDLNGILKPILEVEIIDEEH